MGHIYKHTSPSGKAYIGKSMQGHGTRWQEHVRAALRGGDLVFHCAIRKYGPDAFTREILHDGIDDREELDRLEIEEIARQGTLAPDGYNMTEGGEGGYKKGTLAHANMCAAVRTPEARAANSARTKEFFSDLEVREAHSEIMKAAHANPSSGYNAPGYLEKMAAGVKAHWADPVKRKKQSRKAKANWSNPDFVFHSAEYRNKVSLGTRRAKRELYPNTFGDGIVYPSRSEAAKAVGIAQSSVDGRLKSSSPRFRFWHTIPNHNDPECDAVEECWALMKFAEACPDHENVPDWCRPKHSDLPDDFWA